MSEKQRRVIPSGEYPIESALRWLPERMYVLTLPDQSFEVRETRDDHLALVAYSNVGRLVAACGAGQPWVEVPRVGWEEITRRLDVGHLVIDVDLPDGHRYPEPAEPDIAAAVPRATVGDLRLFVPAQVGRRQIPEVLLLNSHGRRVLPAFTTAYRLVTEYGLDQTWISVPTLDIENLARNAGADTVAVNPGPDTRQWKTAPVRGRRR